MPAREVPADDGDGRFGKLAWYAVHDGCVHAASLECAEGGSGRCGDREQAAGAEPVEHRFGDAERRVAAGEHDPGGGGAGEQSELAGLKDAVGFGPARSGDPVIGELGGDELVGDSSDAQWRSVGQVTAERWHDVGWGVCE